MSAARPRVSVVIRCCNEARHIGRLLTGLAQQAYRDFEIIVVDSGSTDATLEIAAHHPTRVLTIAPERFSFGHSLNVGCRAASGELVVIASAHVYPVYDDWLATLIAPFDDPVVALSYGKQRGWGKTHFSERQIFAHCFPDHSIPLQQNPFCNNANAAIRRRIWEAVPYDELLTGLEDLDWAKRIMQLGHGVAYVAEAEIVHVHNETPARIYNRYRREAMGYRRIFPHERFGFWNLLHLFGTNTASDYFHAAREGQLLSNLLKIPTFRLMQFWGTFRGYSDVSPMNDRLRTRYYYPRGFARSPSAPAQIGERRLVDYGGQDNP